MTPLCYPLRDNKITEAMEDVSSGDHIKDTSYHFVKGLGIKTISRQLGISKNTVRKVIRSGATEHSYNRAIQPQPQLGLYVPRIEELREADWERPRKRRLV